MGLLQQPNVHLESTALLMHLDALRPDILDVALIPTTNDNAKTTHVISFQVEVQRQGDDVAHEQSP